MITFRTASPRSRRRAGMRTWTGTPRKDAAPAKLRHVVEPCSLEQERLDELGLAEQRLLGELGLLERSEPEVDVVEDGLVREPSLTEIGVSVEPSLEEESRWSDRDRCLPRTCGRAPRHRSGPEVIRTSGSWTRRQNASSPGHGPNARRQTRTAIVFRTASHPGAGLSPRTRVGCGQRLRRRSLSRANAPGPTTPMSRKIHANSAAGSPPLGSGSRASGWCTVK